MKKPMRLPKARSRKRRVIKTTFKVVSVIRRHVKKLVAAAVVVLAVLFAIVVDLIQSHFMTQGGLNAMELVLDIMGAK